MVGTTAGTGMNDMMTGMTNMGTDCTTGKQFNLI